jgi:hypothetical protein
MKDIKIPHNNHHEFQRLKYMTFSIMDFSGLLISIFFHIVYWDKIMIRRHLEYNANLFVVIVSGKTWEISKNHLIISIYQLLIKNWNINKNDQFWNQVNLWNISEQSNTINIWTMKYLI